MRLPRGYASLREDLGDIVKGRRRDERMKQHVAADHLGITRETLSRIEKGRAWPGPETLDRMLELFHLEWGDVAVAGDAARASRFFDGSSAGDHRHDLGARVRRGRIADDLSLEAVAASVGISPAQLSRLERGEVMRSVALGIHPEDADLPPADRRAVLKHARLRELAGSVPRDPEHEGG